MGIATAVFSMAPGLVWAHVNLELGKVQIHETQQLKFDFINTATQTISILEAKGSCGCTIVKLPEKAISSGSKATLRAEFTPTKVGSFRKSIKIKTSETDEFTYLYFSGLAVE